MLSFSAAAAAYSSTTAQPHGTCIETARDRTIAAAAILSIVSASNVFPITEPLRRLIFAKAIEPRRLLGSTEETLSLATGVLMPFFRCVSFAACNLQSLRECGSSFAHVCEVTYFPIAFTSALFFERSSGLSAYSSTHF